MMHNMAYNVNITLKEQKLMRKKLISLLGALLTFLLGGGAVYLYLHLNLEPYVQLSLKYGTDMNAVISVLCILSSILAAYLLRRAGHLIFGLISGYRLDECSVFGLGLHLGKDGKLRFGFRRPVKRLCAFLTPPAYDGSSPYRLYLAGGALANAIVGIGLLVASLLLRSVAEMLYVGLSGVMLLAYALMLLLHPANGVLVQTRRLAGNVHLRRATEHNLIVQVNIRQGGSLLDQPEDFFLPYPEELWGDTYVFAAQHNIASRMQSTGRYEEAYDILLRLMALMDDPSFRMPHKDIQRLYITCSCAIAEMMSGAPPKYSERINEPNIELFLGSGGWGTQLMLAQYIRELLVTRNTAAAQTLLNRIVNAPTPLGPGQRRILEDAQAKAAQPVAQEALHA